MVWLMRRTVRVQRGAAAERGARGRGVVPRTAARHARRARRAHRAHRHATGTARERGSGRAAPGAVPLITFTPLLILT